MQNVDQIYADLPPSLRRKLTGNPSSTTQGSSGSSTTKKKADASLAGLVPPVAHSSIPTKLANRAVPLENPAKDSERRRKEKEVAAQERRKRKIANRRRRSGRLVQGNEEDRLRKEAFAVKSLVKGKVSYTLLEPLHELWLGYISELLNLPLRTKSSDSQASGLTGGLSAQPSGNAGTANDVSEMSALKMENKTPLEEGHTLSQMQGWQAKLVKADFHGCKIEVKKAKHPSLVGLAGIVAQETEGTFRLVTSKDCVKVVPKANVTFSFNLPLASKEPGVEKALAFELHGSNFAFRSSDRANKKFKPKGAKGLDY